MKRRGWLSAAALCGIGSAPAVETVTIGVWGYVKVQIPGNGGVNFVGFNFSSDAPTSLKELFSHGQLLRNADPGQADKVYVWDPSAGAFKSYFQKTDGHFYDTSSPSGAAVTVEVQSGDALFLKSPGVSVDHSVYLSGSISLQDGMVRNHASKMVFANLYPVAMNLNSSEMDWSSATSGDLPTLADQVHVWDSQKSGGPGFRNYFLKSVGGVKRWHSGESPFAEADPVIPSGGGAFYTAVGSFSHNIIRPFDI